MLAKSSSKKNSEVSVDRGIGKSIHGDMLQFCGTGVRDSAVLMHHWVTRDKMMHYIFLDMFLVKTRVKNFESVHNSY